MSARAKSPPKFGASDFKKKKTNIAGNRSNAAKIAKFRGLKVDYSELSNREVMTNFKVFGTFEPPDRQRYLGASMSVEGKKLVADDISVTAEFLRRNLEVQSLSMINCGITDVMFAEIADGLSQLRQLKKITLTQNLLTVKSTELIVKLFSNKRVEVLDVRGNNLAYEEGYLLSQAFYPSIRILNAIEVQALKADRKNTKVLLPRLQLREPEIGILCHVLEELDLISTKIDTIDLSTNLINCKALSKFVQFMASAQGRNIKHVDLSRNPITNDASDLSAIEKLLKFAGNSTQMRSLTLDEVFGVPEKMNERVQRSMMVNRSLAGTNNDPDHFSKFAAKFIAEKSKALYSETREIEEQDLLSVDVRFVKEHKIDLSEVSLDRRNVIRINRRVSQVPPRAVEF